MLLRPCTLLVILAALLPLPRAFGQTTASDLQSAIRSKPLPPAADREQFIAYWTTETGWRSELQLRNNQVGGDLTVIPILRTAYGAETPLSAVTIKPQEVKAVDLDAAIGTTAPQLVGTYGSLVLRYRSPGSRSLYAALMIRNIGHPFAFHIDATGESQVLQTASREGVWWLPKETTSDYLILTNLGKTTVPLDLSLYDANGKEAKQRLTLGPRETNRYSIRKLVQAAGLTGSYGGMKVFAAAHAGSLDTVHFLFDQTAAFSAILKMFDHDPNANLEERDFAQTAAWTLRAPMLALSSPDPALAFPPGTKLRPQLFIRNTTGKSIDAALRFHWRSSNTTGAATGPALRLNPYETRRIDVAALQDGATLPKAANWTSVTLTTQGSPDEVMAVAASYDETLRYGAQTPFSDQLAFKWAGGMWEYDPYHSSIITAGNGGTKPTQAAFTLSYNQGAEKYELEQTLQPDEQMWIDVGKLIREHVPDKNGKTLPAGLTYGSYEFRDLTDIAVGSLFEGKVIYDKTYGHVAYGCASCCAYDFATMIYDPLGIPFQGNSLNGVTALESCSGTFGDVSSYFYYNWSTGNTRIATVNTTGNHTGVGVGSTNSNTWANLIYSEYKPCVRKHWAPIAGDNVTVTITSNGKNITGTTQSVVVGQQIALTANYGVTANSQSWSVPGTIVGGFNTALTNGGSTSANLNARSTTFYWVTPANSQTVTFTLNYGNNQIATAKATFNIAGPSSPGIATQLGQVVINPGPFLQFGGAPSNIGIQFTASATPPTGYSNSFVWVQVNTNDTKLITLNNNTTTTCVTTTAPAGGPPFLDTSYPYGTNNPAEDNPETSLDSTQFKELKRNFSATMYLMWTSGLSNSIPVPLGSVSWQWSGDAAYNGSTQTWTLKSSSKSANSFQASNTYPAWNRYSDYSLNPTCH